MNLRELMLRIKTVVTALNQPLDNTYRVAAAHETANGMRKMELTSLLDKAVDYIVKNSEFRLIDTAELMEVDQVSTIDVLTIFMDLSKAASLIVDGVTTHHYTSNQYMQVEQLGVHDLIEKSHYAKETAYQRFAPYRETLTITRPLPPTNSQIFFKTKKDLANVVRSQFRACNKNESLTIISCFDSIRQRVLDIALNGDISCLENFAIYGFADMREMEITAKCFPKVRIIQKSDLPSKIDGDYVQMLFME